MGRARQRKQTRVESPSKAAVAPRPHSTLREYFVTIVVCTILALFVTTYIVHPMTVPTPSMVPTILVGDRLLIDKFSLRNEFTAGFAGTPRHTIRRGDVVVFRFPPQPEVLYVKRAMGLPGETVEVRHRKVFINGQPVEDASASHIDPEERTARDNFGPLQLDDRSYFMMGDNRDDSADSRFWGPLDKNMIIGRPLFVFWSFEDPAYNPNSTTGETITEYANRVIHFFDRTRWKRTFKIIR
ncbi:MAG: signal peptidase I [Acidobacteriota bacterium]